MDKVLELKKLLENKEFKKLTQKLENKAEKLQNEVKIAYEKGDIDNTPVISGKQRFYKVIKIYEEILDGFTDTSEGALIYKAELQDLINRYWNVITNNLVNEIGVPYSLANFTELDGLTMDITEYKHSTDTIVNSLINKLEKKDTKEIEDVYE